ncbi:MAG: acetylxylan esterase [Deinococcus sp.]|nr:acetylxylan esterase [Deinococcus sp.]
MDFQTLSTVAYLDRLYRSTPRQLAFSATTAAEAARWRSRLRRKLVQLIGGFPAERVPLKPELVETVDGPDYRREKLYLQSEPGVRIPLYVLVPHHDPPYRAVVALHGHGTWGVLSVLGLANRPEHQKHIERTNYDFAHQLARHGFLVFAPEQRGFGERMEHEPGRRFGDWEFTSSCLPASLNALLLGRSMQAMRVWDVKRVLDYIATRPEPITKRIGCVGLSGGATVTVFSAALDQRIAVAVVSGYLNLFRTCIMAMEHCVDNYVPGILHYAEMPDVVGLIAPRPLLVECGTKDAIFPIAGAREAYRQLRRIYRVYGASERLAMDEFEGEHRWSGRLAYDWLDQWL